MFKENITSYIQKEDLKTKLTDCREELLNLLEEWHYMVTVLHPQLMFIYDNIFGDLEYEIEHKTLIESDIVRRVELLLQKVRKGEKLTERTIEFVNKMVNNEFRKNSVNTKSEDCVNPKAHKNSYQTKGKYKSWQLKSSNSKITKDSTINKEIPHLYREIVKNLHPDISGESENYKRFWDNIQQAYQTKNYERLSLFHRLLCSEQVEIDSPHKEHLIKKEINVFREQISEEKQKIEKLQKNEPFVYQGKLNDNEWITIQKRKLKEKLTHTERQIQLHRREYQKLTGKHWTKVDSSINIGN